jgi:glycosyltransferase involved in cell wall biosynthesis
VLSESSRQNNNRSLLIVQGYVPAYRVAFFSKLIANLEAWGITCKVAASQPTGQQLDRGDAVDAEWIVPYTGRQLHIAGRTVGLGGARKLWASYDGVVVGHLGSSVDTYQAILDSKRSRIKVGLWGHIKSYVNDGNPLDLALERWQLRNSDHIFAYTSGGHDYAVAAGASSQRVTTVMNATDTSSLVEARDSISEADVQSFMASHGLRFGRTLGYIGGLDASKRIDFLAATLDLLWDLDPEIRVLIGGQGASSQLLSVARDRGQAIMLGYVRPDAQAMIARAASALINPGRIGLVAVDALVLGIPILTTDWKYHAPEHEFLHEGSSRFTSRDNPESFAAKIREFLNYETEMDRPSTRKEWEFPTIDAMVDNFTSGILKMFSLDGLNPISSISSDPSM